MVLVSSCSFLCPIHWSQVLSREQRCSWSSPDKWSFNYIWVIKKFIAYQVVTYIRGLTIIHQGWVIHIHISKLGHHWFILWLITCAVPSRYQWTNSDSLSIRPYGTYFVQNSKVIIEENIFENAIYKMEALLSRPQYVGSAFHWTKMRMP